MAEVEALKLGDELNDNETPGGGAFKSEYAGALEEASPKGEKDARTIDIKEETKDKQ